MVVSCSCSCSCVIDLSIYRSIYLYIYLSIHPSISLSVCLSACLSVCLYPQAWKRSYSARLLQFLNVLYVFTLKYDSRHNGVHFFNIKCSETGVFCTFWFGNALRATIGVQFFISHLIRWLRTHRFSEPTFRPPGATNHWKKHSVSRLSYLFAHLHLLSSFLLFLFYSSLFWSFSSLCSAFHLSILSEVWLLNFLRLNIVKYTYHISWWCHRQPPNPTVVLSSRQAPRRSLWRSPSRSRWPCASIGHCCRRRWPMEWMEWMEWLSGWIKYG